MGSPVMGTRFPYGPGALGPWMVSQMAWSGRPPGAFPAPVWMYTERVPSDEQISSMIYDALDADPLVPPDSDIKVDVKEGVVTLTGTVPNRMAKHAAGDDAWWVPGVLDVHNNVQIVRRHERGRVASPLGQQATR